MNTDFLCIIINLLKSIHSFEMFMKRVDYIDKIDKIATEYKIVSGNELNTKNNSSLTDRLILLKKIDNVTSVVTDFGDFKKYQSVDLLNYYKIKREYIDCLTEIIVNILLVINEWIQSTGYEFILDTNHFKPVTKVCPPNLESNIE